MSHLDWARPLALLLIGLALVLATRRRSPPRDDAVAAPDEPEPEFGEGSTPDERVS